MKVNNRHLIMAIIALLVIWQLAAMLIDRPILPAPIEVGIVFIQELQADLPSHFLASFLRVLASTALAVLVAAPLGIILGQSKRLNAIFSPTVYIIYPIPKVVFVPIILLIFGVIVIVHSILVLGLVYDRRTSAFCCGRRLTLRRSGNYWCPDCGKIHR